ncbi:MAG: phage major capsid protein [Bacillota bacterium]|nr:phage major capsid protein [Bacillota bacterium]
MDRTKMNLQLFAMENPDLTAATKEEFREKLQQALESGDTEAFSQSFMEFMSSIEQAVIREAKGIVAVHDSDILSARGVRQLTSKEREFYQKTIEAMQGTAPANSVNALDVVMPETVVDSVFEDLRADHELLSYIDFHKVTGLVKFLLNTNVRQLAHWGPLNSEITKELESGFKEVTLEQNKLSAYMFVSQDMLDLGPEYLDRYVRAVMYEALAYGLENGIVKGTGKNMPIGMNRQVGEGVTVTDGVYPEKTKIKVTALDPVTYGDLLSNLAKNEKNQPRVVREVIMVVNPVDYLKKIMPATTIRAADGRYVNDILPFPTKVLQSTEVDEGEAVLGLGKRYWMGMGLVKDGKIEHSDDYKFLEDYRAYKIRFLGHGEPKDNNSFVVLDISDLKPAIYKVELIEDIPEV